MIIFLYIILPIIVLLILVVGMILLILNKRRNSLPQVASEVIPSEPHERVIINFPGPNTSQINSILGPNNQPHICKCVYNDDNQIFWKLNCGGLVCNHCIIKISTAMMSSEAINCPSCNNPVFHFYFIDDRVEQAFLENNNKQDNDLDITLVCRICYERPAKKKLDCQSLTPHYLCDFCYNRLIEVQKILLCPFCRTKIKKNFNEEQAPVAIALQ
jgi:hypothetical protein